MELLVVDLTDEEFEIMCHAIDDWMRLMGGGKEYGKLAQMTLSMYDRGIRFNKKYYYINREIAWRRNIDNSE